MKPYLWLAVMTFMGCGGTGIAPDEATGTLESAVSVCGQYNCPTGTRATKFFCSDGCINFNFCHKNYNAAECVATDRTTPISVCGNGCRPGYYLAEVSESQDCRAGAETLPGDSNRSLCIPTPDPGAVPSYTVCRATSTCSTGYFRQATTYSSSCIASASDPSPNAVICAAIP